MGGLVAFSWTWAQSGQPRGLWSMGYVKTLVSLEATLQLLCSYLRGGPREGCLLPHGQEISTG